MARQKYTVSIDSLLEYTPSQLESMSRKDLAAVVTRLRDAGQKRLKRIEKAGIHSPAADYIKRSGGFAKIKGMDVAQLRNEYIRLKGFIGAKTGTVKGARQYTKRTEKDIIDTLNRRLPETGSGAATGGITSADLYEKLPPKIQAMMWALLDKAGGEYRFRYNEYVVQATQSVIDTFDPASYDGSDDAYEAAKENAFEDFMKKVKKEYEKENTDTNVPLSSYYDE